ncbi:Expansin-A24 [Tetrabaena socialis]|uniref:Expansin-A24 n=1 Tax=Tetrabaena socialis TaxID=47790 RepID=A0A2J8AJL6_9CHLO|nr:Expansin-A24 [Tetrabaena socialis]|eukprot:PNH12716.1 Expansin-A24 [Tetrabaena socialis]
MARHALLLACALLAGGLLADADYSGWRPGRATFFDVGPDMSTANCHYSWAPTGRNVGAFSDQMEGFSSSCGKCFEVSCRNADFQDGYGETLSRSNACYDPSKSVVITIVDACPCRYPNNAYSNQRWCCGDMDHIDLSQEAFEQLADLNQGVVAIRFREVDCSATGSSGSGGGGSSGSTPQPQPQEQQQAQPVAAEQQPRSGGWGGIWGRWGR